MKMHIDFAPIEDCKRPELTYGELCIKCNECGRFDYGGVSNPVRSEICLMSQFNPGIPPFWEYPGKTASFLNGKWSRCDKCDWQEGLLHTIPECWINRLDHVRWWIESKNY